MAVETKKYTTGKHQNIRMQLSDIEALRRLRRSDEGSDAVTLHRIIEAYEMYDAILNIPLAPCKGDS
jgi:hypothetical protein